MLDGHRLPLPAAASTRHEVPENSVSATADNGKNALLASPNCKDGVLQSCREKPKAATLNRET